MPLPEQLVADIIKKGNPNLSQLPNRRYYRFIFPVIMIWGTR
jgi:hypothetical protein